MKKITLVLIAAGMVAACGHSHKTTMDAVELPMTADGKVDMEKIPVIEFQQEIYDFGKIVEGEKVSFSFKFKNTGKTPLIISDASASCGCTVPDKPEEPIEPGAEGLINVVFNSAGKMGLQNKSITILANTIPNTKTLYLRGEVTESK